MAEPSLHVALSSDSFLEYAFLRWVLAPAAQADIVARITPQRVVAVEGHEYRVDSEIAGSRHVIAVELDGYQFHSSRSAFNYDRLRQNDIQATGRIVVRFSYDAIRSETARCVEQLQAVLRMDPLLEGWVVSHPRTAAPEMDADPLRALDPSPALRERMTETYFDEVRERLNQKTLRDCQTQAFAALANYYLSGGDRAACVMSVGAGKTALGVAAALAFTRRRAMVITPGSVIRGTFDRALDHQAVGNVLYGLPGGPLTTSRSTRRTCTPSARRTTTRTIRKSQVIESQLRMLQERGIHAAWMAVSMRLRNDQPRTAPPAPTPAAPLLRCAWEKRERSGRPPGSRDGAPVASRALTRGTSSRA